MRKDSFSNAKAVPAQVPAVKTAAGDGATVDSKGFNSVLYVINTGAIAGDGDFGVKVQASANGTDWGDAVAADTIGTTPATLEASSAYRISYIGKHRYSRLQVTKAGGTSIALAAVAILGSPHVAPIA